MHVSPLTLALRAGLIGSALSVPSLSAQNQLFQDLGVASVDKFGYSVRAAGDVNGDGFEDLIYSAPFLDAGGRNNAGLVRVVSGQDFSLLYELTGPRVGDEFGYQVSGVGDVDVDGHDDFLITVLIPSRTNSGACTVHSGATGAVLYQVDGKAAYDYLGISGSGVGDVNADGYPDFATGAPGHDAGGSASGQLQVFSGRDGSELFHRDGRAGGDQYGWFVDSAGDVDRDGHDDVIVGAPWHDGPNGPDSGMVDVLSGADGSVLYTFYGDTAYERFGWSCSRAGDVNADGFDDVIVGGHLSDTANGSDSGLARVFSGFDGSVLHSWIGDAADDWFGYSVRDAGDLDGDGHADLIVGAIKHDGAGTDAGLVRIFSGQDGTILHDLHGRSAGDWFGYSAAYAGDLDHDGYPEIIVGAIYDDAAGVDAGSVTVYSYGGVGTPPVLWQRGIPCVGSGDRLPRLEIDGQPSIGKRFEVALRGAPANTSSLLNFGDPVDIPLDALGAPGCQGYADPAGFNFGVATDATGVARSQIDLPLLPALVGLRFDFQWIVRDAAANSLGFTFSNAAVVKFGG